MPHAVHGDVQLWFERAGSGPPLLFITGTGGDLRQRPNVFDSPLSSQFELASYDHRDTGRSSRPERPFTMEEYAQDAVAVLDALGWSSAGVLGVSFGGMVAQELAIRHPDRVRRLVLACTSSGGAGGSSYPLHELEALEPQDRLRTALGLNDTRYGAAWQEENPADAAALLELAAARSGPSSPRQLEARRRHDTYDRLDSITAPTLVAAGRYDAIAPVANSEALAARIPGARLQVFEGGHLFLLQDPTAFGAMASFLRG